MAYLYNLPNATNGIDDAAVGIVASVPAFVPLLLAFTFLMVFLGGLVSQRRRESGADIQQWAVLASLSTLMVSLLLSTKAGLINLATLGIVIGLTILTGIWFFISKGRNEQI